MAGARSLLTFTALADEEDGRAWQGVFERLWPAYRRWYLRDGHLARPGFLDCRNALERHMPEFVPRWNRLCELAGGGDLAARFLSLWCPPAYDTACSQAIWPGPEPLLVRNYDYDRRYFDALVLRTHWGSQRVLGTSDCLVGLVDGVNSGGLAASLTFGGSRAIDEGFGMPIVLRYVLETCTTVAEASAALARIPTHMSYNVTVLDLAGARATVHVAPDRAANVTTSPVATNHQPGEPRPGNAFRTATVERERFLLDRMMLHQETQERFIGAFLRPPIYSLAFERERGTLYTAALWPGRRAISYRWPHQRWDLSLDDFEPGLRDVSYPSA